MDEHLARLGALCTELASLHRELATLLRAEKEAKTAAWFASDETTLTGRDRIADFNALNLTGDIITLKGEIAALIEERDHLRLLVDVHWRHV